MKHLFVAATEVAAGELTHAARLARSLAGDDCVFLVPRALDAVVAGAGKRGWIDDALPFLDRALLAAIEREQPDAVVLVDGASVAQALVMRGLPFAPLVAEIQRRTRLVALDVWCLDESGLTVDYGADTFRLPEELLALPRLVPVPFARPTVRGGYCALGARTASADARVRVRAELGLGEADPLISFALAAWQLPERQLHPARRALAERVLASVGATLASLPANVHVVQVGPHGHAALDALGPRLHRVGLVPPARYAELLAAADLMFGTNLAATSLISALAYELPALVATERDWLVCPLGMTRFLAPVLAGNPYLDAIATATLAELPTAFTRLLADPTAARARMAAYAARVRALPAADAAYRALAGLPTKPAI